MQAVERHRAGAAGQADAVGDLGNGPDLGIVTFVDRYEQDALLVAHVYGERHVHVREDDDVLQRNEKQSFQNLSHHL